MSFSDMVLEFFCSHKRKHKQTETTLQAPEKTISAYIDNPNNNSRIPKRMSSIFLLRLKAGMTLEASLAVPIFIFFMANIMSLVNVFNTYSEKLSEAQQSAKVQSYMCCGITEAGADTVSSVKSVPIKPFISSISFSPSDTIAVMTYRKWTGYNVLSGTSEQIEDEYVYITEHGISYHRSRNCSHLKISIQAVSSDDIALYRNKSGSKYRACEKCGGRGTGILFITPDGDKYHSDAACSGLKRTIKSIRLSQVGSRTPCSECGR